MRLSCIKRQNTPVTHLTLYAPPDKAVETSYRIATTLYACPVALQPASDGPITRGVAHNYCTPR